MRGEKSADQTDAVQKYQNQAQVGRDQTQDEVSVEVVRTLVNIHACCVGNHLNCHLVGSQRNSYGQSDEDECQRPLNSREGTSGNPEEATPVRRLFVNHDLVDLECQHDILDHKYHACAAACGHLDAVNNRER